MYQEVGTLSSSLHMGEEGKEDLEVHHAAVSDERRGRGKEREPCMQETKGELIIFESRKRRDKRT